MEWVLYLVSNLNGDTSFLSIPAPSNETLPLLEDPPGVNVGAQDHHGQVEEEVIFDGNIDDLHQVQIVEQEDLAEVNMQALEEHDEVQNTVKSLVICLNCYQKSPFLISGIRFLWGPISQFWSPLGPCLLSKVPILSGFGVNSLTSFSK